MTSYTRYDAVGDVRDVTRYYDPSGVLPNKGPNAGDEIIGEAGPTADQETEVLNAGPPPRGDCPRRGGGGQK